MREPVSHKTRLLWRDATHIVVQPEQKTYAV